MVIWILPNMLSQQFDSLVLLRPEKIGRDNKNDKH